MGPMDAPSPGAAEFTEDLWVPPLSRPRPSVQEVLCESDAAIRCLKELKEVPPTEEVLLEAAMRGPRGAGLWDDAQGARLGAAGTGARGGGCVGRTLGGPTRAGKDGFSKPACGSHGVLATGCWPRRSVWTSALAEGGPGPRCGGWVLRCPPVPPPPPILGRSPEPGAGGAWACRVCEQARESRPPDAP